MVLPLPPTVHGPITPHSPSVRVTGVVAGAWVEVLANGGQIGVTFAISNGEVWVNITPPSVDQDITARQSTSEGPSGDSQAVPVVAVPAPLPLPVFVSPLSTGMSKLQLAGLVPGANIELKQNGSIVGGETATDTAAWIGIDFNANLDDGEPIGARQSVGGTSSDWVDSLPIARTRREEALPAPGIGQPVNACETAINVSGATPSADLTIDNEGRPATWYSPASAYVAWGAPPFQQGKIVAKQAFPRVSMESPETTIPVGPAVTPPKPEVKSEICVKLGRVFVSNLVPEGQLTIYTREPAAANPATIVETAIGVAGITASVESFNLPEGLSPITAAGHPVTIVATQTRCGLVSEKSAPAGFTTTAPTPATIPIIAGPLYDCARIIVLQSAHVGAEVQAVSAATGKPLGDRRLVRSPTVFYETWWPLTEGDKVFVRQWGCDANGDSGTERVYPLDDPFPMPKLGEPVRPRAPAVYAQGFLRGAWAHLFVNGVIRSSIETRYSDAWIPTGLPLLEHGDRLTIVQTICKAISQIEQQPVVVTRGQLNVDVSPKPVTRGTTAQLMVTATDKDTGIAVPGGQVLINGQAMGTTGTAFPFSPAVGLAAANGVVKSPPQYDDATFSVPLVDPAPASAAVHLNVGPVVAIPNTLVMKTASWTVVTQWSPTQTFTASGPNVTLTLPKPQGGSGSLVISLATTWEVAGYVLGSEFEHDVFNGMMFPAPTTVVWDGAERTVGFWAVPEVSEADDGTPWLNVVAYFQGVA